MQFLKKYFYVPKYGKVSDKMMASRVVLSAAVIVACLAALSFSAYAWFTYNVSSGANTISAATFGVDVAVSSNASAVTPEEGVYALTNGTYTVQLTRTGNATTGFCIVKVTADGCETAYHTRQMSVGDVLALELNVATPATVTFTPSWGTSVHYGTTGNPLYLENDRLEITIAPDNGEPGSGEQQNTEKVETLAPADPDTAVDGEKQDQQLSQAPQQMVYTVVEGDTLIWIAEEYGSTVEAIAQRNNIADKRTIQIGQKLIIPPAETE